MADRRRRYLQPGFLVRVGDCLWVVDRVQPVAVVLDAATATPVRIISWPEVPPAPTPSPPGCRQVRPAPAGLWVQEAGGPVVLIGDGGLQSGHHPAGLTLAAVTAHGAWCVPDPVSIDLASGEAAGRAGGPQLLLVRPDRPTTSVFVDAPVTGACAHDGDLYLAVETGPDAGWLRLAAGQPVPAELSLAEHGTREPSPVRPSDRNGGRHLGTRWSAQDEAGGAIDGRRRPTAEEAGGVRWSAGWDRDRPGPSRTVVAVARDVAHDRERFRVDVGPGDLAALVATAGYLWLAVEVPRPTGNYTAATPTTLVRVHARTGAVETILPAAGFDITEHCWPLPAEPVDAADYAAFSTAQFAGLGAYWTDPDGATFPLAEGVSDSRVEVVGRWPDTALRVTFGHAARPGVRLRHTVSLYDELGRPVSARYAAIYLMEDLETGTLPDVCAAQDGYLDV